MHDWSLLRGRSRSRTPPTRCVAQRDGGDR
jgi:hypothetical protein